MGLFDFITKTSGSNSNSQQDDSAQNPQGYQTQQDERLVQTPFSEVRYPLPLDQQQEEVAVQNQPQVQQNYQDQPNDLYDQNYNYTQQDNSMQFPVQDSQYNQVQQNDTFQDPNLNQNPDQFANPEPQENSLQFPVQESVTEMQAPVADNQLEAPQQDYLQYSPQFDQNQNPTQNQPVVAEVAQSTNNEPVSQTQEELPPLPDVKPVTEDAQSEANIMQEPSAIPAQIEPALQEAPVEEAKVEPTQDLVVGTETTKSESEELPPLPDPKPQQDIEIEANPEPEVSETTESVDNVVVGGPKDEVDLDTEIFNDIKNAVKDEYEKDQMKATPVPAMPAAPAAVTNIKEDIEEEPANEELKVFKNIAMVGLNVQNSEQTTSEKLMELVRLLSAEKTSFILDSGKGYGENLLNKLLERKDTKVVGAYLKPFYSDYSDEPKAKINTESYSTAIFSNLDLKLKYLIKSADIFVMPYTSGLSNMSLLFALVANSYLYYGQHKPLILLGKEWRATVDSLKSTLNLSDVESEQFVVCDEPADVLALIRRLDKEYSEKSSVSVNKVIDMRNESDESEYFVNNI